jgi:hypothetical protein
MFMLEEMTAVQATDIFKLSRENMHALILFMYVMFKSTDCESPQYVIL